MFVRRTGNTHKPVNVRATTPQINKYVLAMDALMDCGITKTEATKLVMKVMAMVS